MKRALPWILALAVSSIVAAAVTAFAFWLDPRPSGLLSPGFYVSALLGQDSGPPGQALRSGLVWSFAIFTCILMGVFVMLGLIEGVHTRRQNKRADFSTPHGRRRTRR